MIHYHGTPITPDPCAIIALKGGHACISFANPGQIGLASEICQSFFIDNGAFPRWKKEMTGKLTHSDTWDDWWDKYINDFLPKWMNHPRCDFAVIPDVIDGGEKENQRLIDEWPYGTFGVPVWHMNESEDKFIRLCDEWPRVAIGSCGEYDISKNPSGCVLRVKDIMRHVVDEYGHPKARIHMLRGLNKNVFTKLPFSSADSTNIAKNIGIDKNWQSGAYQPHSKTTRAWVLRERIESNNSASSLTYDEASDRINVQLSFNL